jgi:hypothetical protein
MSLCSWDRSRRFRPSTGNVSQMLDRRISLGRSCQSETGVRAWLNAPKALNMRLPPIGPSTETRRETRQLRSCSVQSPGNLLQLTLPLDFLKIVVLFFGLQQDRFQPDVIASVEQ